MTCSDDFWAAVAGAIKRHNVSFLGGDFNMALFDTAFQLRKHRVDATFLGSHVWLDQNAHGGGAPDQLQDCRHDSLGLFAVTAVSTISRFLVPAELRKDEKAKLQRFEKGPHTEKRAPIRRPQSTRKAPARERKGGEERREGGMKCCQQHAADVK